MERKIQEYTITNIDGHNIADVMEMFNSINADAFNKLRERNIETYAEYNAVTKKIEIYLIADNLSESDQELALRLIRNSDI